MGRVDRHAYRRDVDEGEVMSGGEHPGDTVRRRGALLDQRIRDRRAVDRSVTYESERIRPDQVGRTEQVEHELRCLVDAERQRGRLGGRRLFRAIGSSWAELHGGALIGDPSNGLSACPGGGLTRVLTQKSWR
jgi:hypothetical protein